MFEEPAANAPPVPEYTQIPVPDEIVPVDDIDAHIDEHILRSINTGEFFPVDESEKKH
jgi:hypothetical protein